jgi:hypothetical protein
MRTATEFLERKHPILAVLIGLCFFSGCGGGQSSPPSAVLTSITVSPATVSLALGGRDTNDGFKCNGWGHADGDDRR